MDQRELYCHEMREYKRRRYSLLGDKAMIPTAVGGHFQNQGYMHGRLGEEHSGDMEGVGGPPSVEEAKQYRRKDELLSYIVRLAHDEDFRGFVDELERGLELAAGSNGIHAAFGF